MIFGPDGMLYVSTGEGGQPERAQDRQLARRQDPAHHPGRQPAPGNPDAAHRSGPGATATCRGWPSTTQGRLWASEFGQDTYDELNLIQKGHDYGWPIVEGKGGGAGMTDPQITWPTDDASPSGLAFLDGRLWLGALRGERLWRVDVHGGRASAPKAFFVGRYGRLRTVVAAPDGNLWVTTSNRDGRGDPASEDDRILLVRP